MRLPKRLLKRLPNKAINEKNENNASVTFTVKILIYLSTTSY